MNYDRKYLYDWFLGSRSGWSAVAALVEDFGSKNTTDPKLLKIYQLNLKVNVYCNSGSPAQSTLQVGVKRRLLYWGLLFAWMTPLIWMFAFYALTQPWAIEVDGSSGLL